MCWYNQTASFCSAFGRNFRGGGESPLCPLGHSYTSQGGASYRGAEGWFLREPTPIWSCGNHGAEQAEALASPAVSVAGICRCSKQQGQCSYFHLFRTGRLRGFAHHVAASWKVQPDAAPLNKGTSVPSTGSSAQPQPPQCQRWAQCFGSLPRCRAALPGAMRNQAPKLSSC